MSDEKKRKRSSASDAEYEYSDDTLGQEPEEGSIQEAPQVRSLKDKILQKLPKKKKLMLIIFLVIIVYVIYKLLSAGSTPPPPSAEKAVSQPLSTAPKVPAIPAAMPVTALSTTTATPEQAAQIRGLQTSLVQSNQLVAALQNAVQILTASVINLSDRLTFLEQTQAQAVSKQPVGYQLQSVVSGRAWLRGKKGKLTSVKVGDSLTDYGQIEGIDVDKGIVYTSSGREIHYGPHDS